MQKLIFTSFFFILTAVLTACSGIPGSAQNISVGSANVSVTTPPVEAGKTTFVGRVVSTQSGAPLADTVIRLAEVHRQNGEGAYVLNGASSPGGTTDNTGTFVIPNIEAREYVVIVGDVYTDYVVISEPSGKARVWNPPAGDVMNVGELKVNL